MILCPFMEALRVRGVIVGMKIKVSSMGGCDREKAFTVLDTIYRLS
jgi:hypothetical protein